MALSSAELAHHIEDVVLKPDGTEAEVVKLCAEAIEWRFAAVCVHGVYAPLAASLIKGSAVGLTIPIGFPFGANTTATKVFEAEDGVRNGATELDMMMFMGAFKSGRDDLVLEDIQAVVKAAQGRIVKVIVETALLSRDEKVRACRLAVEGGANYVKTSTGNGLAGANVEDIRLMRETVGPHFGVKASGGIVELDQVMAFIEAGADRIASRVAVRIMESVASPV